jgi:hypothetical protein
MMSEISQKIQFKRNLAKYLDELKMLTGKDISPKELTSIEEVGHVRAASMAALKGNGKARFAIAFDERTSDRFRNFVLSLRNANSRPVYIWTDRSDSCGLYKVESIDQVNFAFPFDINSNGVVTFRTEDFSDKLLLDFSEDDLGERILEVELTGKHWSLVQY